MKANYAACPETCSLVRGSSRQRIRNRDIQIAEANKRFVERGSRDPDIVRDFPDGRTSASPNVRRLAPVSGLCARRRPAAVPGLVVSVHVDPIERRAGGTGSHVCSENAEVRAPLIAHRDPATTVAGVTVVRRVKAPVFGSSPRHVGGVGTHPVVSGAFSYLVDFQAPTTLRVAGRQFVTGPCDYRAAFAAADPMHSDAISRGRKRRVSEENQKTTVFLASTVN